ncbi:hypothetical protein DFH08DRAFT_1081168 [Mycena albidolilacea]|uniref:Uncharacterized protein n=1 Tax=Mycena albidolilacea TaxID=1033008 RepID=A0AAD6ZZA1_9AGAR|nr:hypothetical protein DFH08DRAFT_1081168 [Mycena albidolilacea]
MPVSFLVAKHPAKPFSKGLAAYTADETLSLACPDQHKKVEEILQFSLDNADVSGCNLNGKITNLIPNQNGFVATLLEAYTQDHALVIRPDDVWLAILSQFNFFVNAHAELVRANFVAHEGTRELLIEAGGTRYTVDFGALAHQMTDLVEKNVVDPELRAWALPNFTTTTTNDTTVSAVLLMATLKQYFTYKIVLRGCGIPRVTLEGEHSDWVRILERLEKLKEYGLETTAWYHLLRPIMSRFVAAFDDPTSAANVDFWQRIAHYTPGGSGIGDYYTGWITAFTVFSKEGKWLGKALDQTRVETVPPDTLPTAEFWATYLRPNPYASKEQALVLDGTPYHQVSRTQIPPGYAEVDVALDDNGELFACAMVAGAVGMRVCSSADDTVRPVAGWWMFVKKEGKEKVEGTASARGGVRGGRRGFAPSSPTNRPRGNGGTRGGERPPFRP